MIKMNRRLIREKDTIRKRKTNKIFLGGSEVKNPPANTGDGLHPWVGMIL